ncbi:L-sorbose 1-dehydrogenase-like [Ixodes scapularis]|uniref:L-sorbose 1-dehydrogenase-like n=1 Tax=Ixodes scapularis TaxID=6945 RepID=UPI001A9E6C7F|nr:L-sorbose 1-dehydrogenase-like [Ixodes scapularis]
MQISTEKKKTCEEWHWCGFRSDMLGDIEIPFLIPKWGVFLLAQLMAWMNLCYPPSMSDYNTVNLRDEYDYVIVGGGPAGCVLANRLSANPNVTVLLLEAGGLENAATDVPMFAPLHFHGPYDWDYHTEPQNNSCQSMEDKVNPWPRGKVLGGCSVLNFMMYVRGNKRDFDSWAHDYGAHGWSYEEVLPYFKSIETFNVEEFADNGYHGHKGELPIGYPNTKTVLSDVFLEAGKELGYDYVDYNGPTQTGFSRIQVNVKDGQRYSSSKAFIQPIVGKRKNLHISLLSMATRILFKKKHAYGVKFERGAEDRKVLARREVIVSCGAIGTAQLLMLSGIGPAHHLKELDIPVVADLPVGEGLQDHFFVGGIAATTQTDAELNLKSISTVTQYAFGSKGPLAVPAGIEAVAFVSTPHVNASLDFPDIEIVLLSISPSSSEGERYLLDSGLTKEVYDAYYKPHRGKFGFQLAPVLNRPKSRGYVRLKTTDPHGKPLINPNYLSHPEEVEAAAFGKCNVIKSFYKTNNNQTSKHVSVHIMNCAKKAVEIMQTAAFARLGTRLWPTVFPACEGEGDVWSEQYLRCMATQYTCTTWHPCCTARMGDGPHAVVDSRLRVRGGVAGLRVIDASVMPIVITANLNAATHMIAEKGAAMIQEEYDPKPSGV